jgi:hypothetical protein
MVEDKEAHAAEWQHEREQHGQVVVHDVVIWQTHQMQRCWQWSHNHHCQ